MAYNKATRAAGVAIETGEVRMLLENHFPGVVAEVLMDWLARGQSEHNY